MRYQILFKTVFFSAIIGLTLGTSACKNKASKEEGKESIAATKLVPAQEIMQVDEVLAKGDSLKNKEITVSGVCTHVCAHTGRKLFLMGSDDTNTIRIESTGNIGQFNPDCVNAIVTVKGVLKEERIDEAYLQKMEQEKAARHKEEEHGEEGKGCATEMKARGEKASPGISRIAAMRKRIEAEKEKTGKDFLSFYFIKATDYEIAK